MSEDEKIAEEVFDALSKEQCRSCEEYFGESYLWTLYDDNVAKPPVFYCWYCFKRTFSGRLGYNKKNGHILAF